jgi:uncharacterized protein (DUF58 family)
LIYPSGRAVAAAAAGAPLAIVAGLVHPLGWTLAGAWLCLIGGLILTDTLVGPSSAVPTLDLQATPVIGMGARGRLEVVARFAGGAPHGAQAAVEATPGLEVRPDRFALPVHGEQGVGGAELVPVRRGPSEIGAVTLRWRGPLGLVWKQTARRTALPVAVTPDIEGVKAQAVRFFARDATFGLKAQLDTGEGSEFHALREVQGAVDPRRIDWKQSARHARLVAKEYRAERNHPVVVAVDAGHGMCAPLAGEPRIDRAINAALVLGYVCLKMGDTVGAYGFDARPRGFSGLLSGAHAFPRLQRHLAQLDYSASETNYTLGLSQLGALLRRRTLIVVFTDFADGASAELMVETIARLLTRHVVLFVAFRDEALEAIAAAEPTDAMAMTRAVTAHALLESRALVIVRLERLGVRIVDAPASRMGPALVSAYLDLVRAEVV